MIGLLFIGTFGSYLDLRFRGFVNNKHGCRANYLRNDEIFLKKNGRQRFNALTGHFSKRDWTSVFFLLHYYLTCSAITVAYNIDSLRRSIDFDSVQVVDADDRALGFVRTD